MFFLTDVHRINIVYIFSVLLMCFLCFLICNVFSKLLLISLCGKLLVDEFQKKQQTGQTEAEGQNDEGARHSPQRQRLVASRTLLILHFASINPRLSSIKENIKTYF